MGNYSRAILFVVPCIVLLLATGLAGAQGWPTEGGDLYRGSQSSSTLKMPLGLKWSYNTDGGISGSMALFDGELYVASWDGYLYAINASNGGFLWKTYTGAQIFASPSVTDNTLFLGSGHDSLQAISRGDGSILWEFPTRGPVTASPVVIGELVILGSQDGNIYAIDGNSGEIRWRYDTGSPVALSPCYLNGTVYVAGENGVVWAINATTGIYRNSVYLGAGVEQSPVISHGVGILVAAGDCIYALGTEELKLLWETCFGQNVSTGIALSEQQIYFGTEDDLIRSVEILFQRQQWGSPLGTGPISTPLITKNALIWVASTGKLVVVNPINGFLMWETDLGTVMSSPPIAYNNTLYLALQDGTVLALSHDYPPYTETIVPTTTPGSPSLTWTFPPNPTHTELPSAPVIVVIASLVVAVIISIIRRH